MYYNNFNNQNPYAQYPYMRSSYPVCPYAQNCYGYYQPTYDNFYRTDIDDNFISDDLPGYEYDLRTFDVTREMVENIAANIKKESTGLLKDLEKFIKDSRLLDYILIAVITFICRTYYKYKDVIEEKTDDLVAEMKEHLPWVFDILKLFGVTAAMVDKFLDNLIRLTVVNLKKLLPK
jgi:hypothetical protein